jgi:hypothetical protein
MAITTYAGWVADGQPHPNAVCIDDFANKIRSYGYTVYTMGNDAHLHSIPPEDHCPFSNTAWPGAQPYPHVMALDIMPGGKMDWRDLGAKIFADKQAGVPGTEWIKYMNWTDRAGNCYHDKWMFTYSRSSSSDTGHIHISARTDYVNAHVTYDPIATGDDFLMALTQKQQENLYFTIMNTKLPNGKVVPLHVALTTLLAKADFTPEELAAIEAAAAKGAGEGLVGQTDELAVALASHLAANTTFSPEQITQIEQAVKDVVPTIHLGTGS